MRRFLLGFVAVLGLSACSQTAQAQAFTNAGDPFFLYYGFYLPRQQALSYQQGPEAIMSSALAGRQMAAMGAREGLYDQRPSDLYDVVDPLNPFAGRGRPSRL